MSPPTSRETSCPLPALSTDTSTLNEGGGAPWREGTKCRAGDEGDEVGRGAEALPIQGRPPSQGQRRDILVGGAVEGGAS